MKKLSELQIGEKGILSSVEDDFLEQQLLEMGVTPGQVIELERKSPFKDPIAILVSNLLLSVRLSDAEKIIINIENE